MDNIECVISTLKVEGIEVQKYVKDNMENYIKGVKSSDSIIKEYKLKFLKRKGEIKNKLRE